MGRKVILSRYITLLPLYHAVLWSYAVLAEISLYCPPLEGRLLTCYSPVRHYSITVLQIPINLHHLRCHWTVRLACLKRAASVHPEPGSNSHIKIWWACSSNLLFNVITVLFSYVRTIELCLLCLIIKVLIVASLSDVSYNTSFSLICQHFFQSFFKTFLLPNLASLDALENFLILLQTN